MDRTAQTQTNYDAIVIGGGIGGLSFAAVAAGLMGKKILIIEKNTRVGGRLTSFHKDGFTLDIGAHVISQSEKGPLGNVLKAVKKDGMISWKHVRPMTSYRGDIFPFPKGLEGRIPPDQYQKLTALMREMVQMDDAATGQLDDIDLLSFALGRSITDPLVLACLNNIAMVYICVPHYQTSAGEFIRCLKNEAISRASGYPAGGCSAISDALADGIKENGGENFKPKAKSGKSSPKTAKPWESDAKIPNTGRPSSSPTQTVKKPCWTFCPRERCHRRKNPAYRP